MSGSAYDAAGVSIEANDRAVGLMADRIARAGATRPEVVGGLGGFAGGFLGSFSRLADPVLISATDGVGTKLSIAQTLGRNNTVGIDLVAMVADDIVCVGAEPLFLLDYIACGKNDPERIADIVEGIAVGCAQAGMALIGGETAEHPGMMEPDEYDLAAFGVGVVDRGAMIGPEQVRDGDVVIGFGSSGLHSNGYSLVRKIILDKDLTLSRDVPGGRTLGEELLEPCRIHAPAVLACIAVGGVHAAAHITGGGLAGNLARALPVGLGARIDANAWERPAIFSFIQAVGDVSTQDMRAVFNDGIGMVLVVDPSSEQTVLATATERGEVAMRIGTVVATEGVTVS